jgi:oligopeptidase A
MDATMGWFKHVTDAADIDGLPESAKAAAQQAAQRKELEGWVFTLDIPSYLPVMLHAKNRALREEMYRAYATRASDQGTNPDWDNTALITEILALRQEAAHLLGFEHYAARSLASKMATDTQQVIGFLDNLAIKAKPQAEKELLAIREFASTSGFEGELQSWDIPFYSERLKENTNRIFLKIRC